ncbi:MAG: DNA-processing protein DprA [Cyanobacteriota bacterium]
MVRARVGWDWRRRCWWLLWSRCPGIGWVRLRQLEMACGGLEAAWEASAVSLSSLSGWNRGLIGQVERFRARWGADPLPRFCRSEGWGRRALLPGDLRWPEGISQLERPPLVLHWQGRGSLWVPLQQRRAVAVVGTRRPSAHGLAMARRLGAALAQAGWPVVSGLAEGIDAAAHQGCLEAGGVPVGVLGTPLERVYPRHHGVLQASVCSRGLLVSEQPKGAAVQAAHFARRNRLQVALACALVVVECPEASGALHSADLAWKQGLPLWAVPADAARSSALGSNRLLVQGATPLLDPAEWIHQLGPGPLVARGPGPLRPPGPADRHQSRLLKAVAEGASLEQLSLVLERPALELTKDLLDLELAGLVRSEPGLRWRPC